MEGINIQKNSRILRNKRTYLSLLIALIIMVLLFPREGKFKYEYQKGRPWIYETLTAPIDFPILKSNAELAKEKDELASTIIPYFKKQNDISELQIQEFYKNTLNNNVNPNIIDYIEKKLVDIYNKGVIPDNINIAGNSVNSKNDYIIIIDGKSSDYELVNSLFTNKKAARYLSRYIEEDCNISNGDSLVNALNINDILIPNLYFDQITTELSHKKAIDYISPTKGMIYTGQLIVNEGETVTSDIEQILDSYKAEYKLSTGYSGSFLFLFLGHILIVLVFLSLFFITIYFVNFGILGERNSFNFLLLLVIISFVITVVVRSFNASYLYMIPYAVFALYMMAFFKAKMVMPIYMVSLLPILIIAENGVELYLINVFAGFVSLVSFTYLNRGWLQFLSSFFIFIAMFIVLFYFRLI